MSAQGSQPPFCPPSEQVDMEGYMLKRGSRMGWKERYFALAETELSYYGQRGDVTPKGTYNLSESDCTISDVYIRRRQKGHNKDVIYCVKLTWYGSKSDISLDGSLQTYDDLDPLPPPPPEQEDELQYSDDDQLDPMSPASTHKTERVFRSELKKSPFRKKEKSKSLTLRRARSAPSSTHSSSLPPTKRSPVDVSADSEPSVAVLSPMTEPRGSRRLSATPARTRTPDIVEEHKEEGIQKHYKQQMAFDTQTEQELMYATYLATEKANKRKRKKRIVKGSKIAVTAGAVVTVGVLTVGVGLVAGMIALGAAAATGGGTGAVAAGSKLKRKKKGRELTIASTDFDEVKQWKSILDACLASESVRDSTWGQMFAMEGRNTTTCLLPTIPRISRVLSSDGEEQVLNNPLLDENSHGYVRPRTHWTPLEGGWATLLGTAAHGLRIFVEEETKERDPYTLFHAREQIQNALLASSVKGRPCTPLKGHLILQGSALNAFMCLMSHNRFHSSVTDFGKPNSGQRASFRIIETIDDHMDVIHLVFRPVYLFPSWTKARDFVLCRYWRLQSDGTYLVCYDSVQHQECPPSPCLVRGELHGAYTIAPRKVPGKSWRPSQPFEGLNEQTECLLTAVVQVEPRGWIPTYPLPPLANQGYGEAFAVATLLQVLDIRDALDHDRFVHHHHHMHYSFGDTPSLAEKVNEKMLEHSIHTSPSMESGEDDDYDFSYSGRERTATIDLQKGIMYPPQMPMTYWAEPDSNSFRVRGKNYKKDEKKFNAGSSVCQLIAVDIVRTTENIVTGFSVHPTERIQVALERERREKAKGLESDLPPFFFLVNICLPGPPCYHMVFYYAVDDMSKIDGTNGTPESKLANEFFFGSSDEMRDRTFKLIPQIVVGNFVVKKAVGETPCIMGDKIRQLYVRSERFCEVVLDCGSSSVAAGVLRLCIGYAKTIVVDMGFLLEGNDESTLPEKIFGCVRLKHVEFGPNLRFVPMPPSASTESSENS